MLLEKLFNQEIVEVIGDSLDTIKPDTHFIFTGKGLEANNNFHLGHYLLWRKLAKLSADYTVLLQISDLQKNLGKNFDLDVLKKYSLKFLKTIDFNWRNTKLFFDSDNFFMLSTIANFIATKISLTTITKIFGVNCSFYDLVYYCYQLAPLAYSRQTNKTAVIITASDQKGPFLLARDIANKMNFKKPTIIVVKGLLDLQLKEKMSSSNKDKLSYNEEGKWDFTNIKKAISGETNTTCFCLHLLDHLKKITDIRSITELQRKSVLKQQLIEFLLKETKFLAKKEIKLTRIADLLGLKNNPNLWRDLYGLFESPASNNLSESTTSVQT